MKKPKGTEAGGGQGAASGGGSRRRILTPLATILLGVVALAAGVVVAMGPRDAIGLVTGNAAEPAAAMEAGGHGEADASGHGQAEVGGHGAATAKSNLTVTPFKEIIVNITSTTATGRQTTRFLKLNVALVYDTSAAGAAGVEARMLYLRDSFQDYLRLLSERDLQGSYGLAMMKTELLRRARVISGSDAPREILISDLIVQ